MIIPCSDYPYLHCLDAMLGGPLSPWHGMARPQDADGEDSLQLWRVAANKVNKQLQTADKEWASSLGVGHGANSLSLYKMSLLQKFTMSLGFGRIQK
jgi:hypothetical protein